MGTKISIDKHFSYLDDILEKPPNFYQKVKFQSKISPDITQHLKIWKFKDDKQQKDFVLKQPVPLNNLGKDQFYFSQDEAYVILLIYKANAQHYGSLAKFPHSLWGIVQSAENMTPRGLQSSIASNVSDDILHHHALDSFLLSKRREDASSTKNEEAKAGSQGTASASKDSSKVKDDFKYMIFVWNGKETGAMVKATALTKGYELDNLLVKGKEAVLNILFSGGVIRQGRLQRGSVYVFDDVIDKEENAKKDNPNAPSSDDIARANETVYLFKWLFPQDVRQAHQQQSLNNTSASSRKPSFQQFAGEFSSNQSQQQDISMIQSPSQKSSNYWSNFQSYDDQEMDVDQQFKKPNQQKKVPSVQGIPKLSGLQNIQQYDQQKPQQPLTMNKLNLGAVQQHQNQASEPVRISPQKKQKEQDSQQQPQVKKPITGLNIDLTKPKQIQSQENNQDSQITHSKQQKPQAKMGGIPNLKLNSLPANNAVQESSRQQVPVKKGFGLDLSKAQSLRDEQLNKAQQLINKPNMPQQQDNTSSNSSGGVSLQINIANTNRVREVTDQEHQQQPQAKMGLPQMNGLNLQQVQKSQGNQEQQINEQNDQEDDYSEENLSDSFGNENSSPHQNVSKEINNLEHLKSLQQQNHLQIMSNLGQGANPNQQILTDEQFGYDGTARKQYENALFNGVCSEIIDGFLYLGSDNVARNKELLDKNGVTHVINCASDYCGNYHEGHLTYKSYHLKDHVRENIECIFYDALQFMIETRANGGRVYVHCHQGISRSATLCICYMIFTQKLTFEEAYSIVKSRRSVANPNFSFITQLICFYKRLYGEYNQITTHPRVFITSSHELEDAQRIVCRMLMENLYIENNDKVLDPRGIFIIQSQNDLFIWIGSEIPKENYDYHFAITKRYCLENLHKYEHGAKDFIIMKQGQESLDFWKLFGLDHKPDRAYDNIKEWNNFFINMADSKLQVKKAPASKKAEEYIDITKKEQTFKPRMFVYPQWNQSQAVFEMEDLEPEKFVVICRKERPQEFCSNEEEEGIQLNENIAFIWRGEDFEEIGQGSSGDVIKSEDFVQKVMDQYWGPSYASMNIKQQQEEPDNESEQLMFLL